MSGGTVLVDREEVLGIITINRPEALNALNGEVISGIKRAVLEIESDPAIKVIIITGAGEKAFAAGADIAEMAKKGAQEAKEFSLRGHELMDKIETSEKPVIAAINGFALGGGCELAMACDMRVASDKAKFGQPEVNLGIIPAFGGTQRLLRLVGKGMTKMLIMSARMIDAATALRIGLVDMVTTESELIPKVRKLALEIAGKSQNAVRLAKLSINAGHEMGLKAGNDFEAENFSECFRSAEQKEGMAAFLEKRPAKF
ncbi:MAG: enoyl-CoA hydratase/isomerase family protein [Acidaminococcales bacterium]|jgi:enoyl-CoA hydratase|nr:enoyl-CoA hydratase/isomerase family protein [Acidaminococcales bacterium]